MILSDSRIGIEATAATDARAGGCRELWLTGGLLPQVRDPSHLTGGVCISARARVQFRVIALQLRRSVSHSCDEAQPPVVGHRDPATAQTQH